MHVRDQLNNVLLFKNTPRRIVSLVPSQTELLADLDLSQQIVGVTKFCVHPKNIRELGKVVGGTKNVDFDKIRTLRPDIIICNKEENTKEIVEECQQIAPTWVSDIFTVQDNLKMIKSLGLIFNKEKNAVDLIMAIKSELKDFKFFMLTKPVKRVAYVIWKNPYMLAGQNTYINELLKLNTFENSTMPATRYPEVDFDFLSTVDLVLLSTEPFPFKEMDVLKIKNALHVEARLVDGEYFSWYGSRFLKAFKYFKKLH